MFADPAEASASGMFAFEKRGGVDAGAKSVIGVEGSECVGDAVKAFFDNFVVVGDLSVMSDVGGVMCVCNWC